MLRQLFLSRWGVRTLTIPRRNVITSGLQFRTLALRSISKPRFSGFQHVISAPLPQHSTISGELGYGPSWVRTFTSGPAPGNQTEEKNVSQKNDEDHTGPLAKWKKAEVENWLGELKSEAELKFEVASVAARGDLFADFTREDFKDMVGPVGIPIFIAKEKLLAREKKSHAGPEFPTSFRLQQTVMPFDHLVVGAEPVVDRIMCHIREDGPKVTTPTLRVPPVAIVSLARSGKTTILHTLFNRLLTSDEHDPVLVTFNGSSTFSRREGESDVDAFLRVVAAALLPDDAIPKEMVCSEAVLETYLSKSTKCVVLLVDELNALSSNPSQALASLLRRMFLDQPGRYLCFTSHWFVSLQQTLDESPRNAHVVPVPWAQSMSSLTTLFPDTPLVPAEVASYLGLPGLLWAVKVQHFSPRDRFNHVVNNNADLLATPPQDALPQFLSQFCSGNPYGALLAPFQRFTIRDQVFQEGQLVHKILWPLCYAEPFLTWAGMSDLANLFKHAQNASEVPTERHGDEWEFTVRCAIGLVANCAKFRTLTEIEQRVIGPVTEVCMVHIVPLPADVKTPEIAREYLESKLSQWAPHLAILLVAYPVNPSFEQFDTMTCFRPAGGSPVSQGQQMKIGATVPKKDAPAHIPGVLFRGEPPPTCSPTKRRNWDYLSASEIEAFLPYSLRPLMPAQWPVSE